MQLSRQWSNCWGIYCYNFQDSHTDIQVTQAICFIFKENRDISTEKKNEIRSDRLFHV